MPFAVFIVASPVLASTPGDFQRRLGALVEEAREQASIPALAVAVMAEGEVVAELACGLGRGGIPGRFA